MTTSRSLDLGAPAVSPPGAGRPAWHTAVLGLDAVACAAVGLVLATAPGWLADGLLVAPGGVRAVGAVFLLASVVNGVAARTGSRLVAFVAIDLDVLIGLGAAAFLVAGPEGAATWARTLVGALVAVCVVVGGAKLTGLRRPTRARGGARPVHG